MRQAISDVALDQTAEPDVPFDMDSGEERRIALAEAIVRYLAEHPEAADTLVGIRQWWLGREFPDVPDSDVSAVLADLVRFGRISRTRLADGTEIYSRGRSAR